MSLLHDHTDIYLNNAATSWPKPPSVLQAIEESLSFPYNEGGRGVNIVTDYIYEARKTVSDFFRVHDEDHVIFTHNATDALNTLIQGYTRGIATHYHVISSDLEHNSVIRPLSELERMGLLDVTYLPQKGGYIDPDQLVEEIRPDTRLAVMTHGSNVIGTVQDINEIGKIFQDLHIFFIVDGSQTAGHIPVDLNALPSDAYVFTGHKGLFGVPGTGGFYIRDHRPVLPVRYGGTGTNSPLKYQPDDLPEKYESGTHNFPGLAALTAGISYINSTGIEEIRKKGHRQISNLIQYLKDYSTIEIHNRAPDLPIISCNISGVDNGDIGYILAKVYHIITRTGLHCSPRIHQVLDNGKGSVRLSLSWFTTDEECRITAESLGEIAKKIID